MFINRRIIFKLTLLVLVSLLSIKLGLAQTGNCASIIQGNSLPDLIVDGKRLKADLILSTEKFAQTACAVVEGCVSSRGTHLVLRFSSSTPNVGLGDLVIGDPKLCLNLFKLSECHNHLHFKEYSDYRLWTQVGFNNWTINRNLNQPTNTGTNATLLAAAVQNGDLILGRKQGFCIIDVERYSLGAPATKKYMTCGAPGVPGTQGLQVGWTDVYGQSLDCQYIQIDNLREGTYVLEDHVNPEQLLPESDYTNNSSAVQFYFTPKHAKTPASIGDAIVLP